jgi:hypothetical protein
MSLWDVLVSTFWFMLLFAWIWMLISILEDIFRDHELSGLGRRSGRSSSSPSLGWAP